MEVEFSLTLDDVVALVRAHQRRNRPAKVSVSSMWVWLVILAFLVGQFLVNRFAGGDQRGPSLAGALTLGLGVFLGGGLMLCLFISLGKVFIQTQKGFAQDPRNQWFFTPQRVTISPDGFTTASWFSATMLRWATIWDIAVTSDHAFFWTTTNQAHIVPRRAFSDQHHFQAFVALTRQYRNAPKQTGIMTGSPPRSTDIFRREDS